MTAINFQEMFRAERKKERELRRQQKIPTHHYDLPGVPENLEDFRVEGLSSIYYIPSFLSSADEEQICNYIEIENDSSEINNSWKQLTHRRLKTWGGIPCTTGMYKKPLPTWLAHINRKLVEMKGLQKLPNHVLLNEYTNGKGIGAHFDGPLYEPEVAVLNLCGPAVIEYISQDSEETIASLLLQPHSLLIFKEDAYLKYKHRISTQQIDTIDSKTLNTKLCSVTNGEQISRGEIRLSLTLRTVKKVLEGDTCFTTDIEKDENARRETFFFRSIAEEAN